MDQALVPIDWRPARRTLRNFGFVALMMFGALAYATWHNSAHGAAAAAISLAIGALGLASAVCSLVRPEWNRPLYLSLTLASLPIAWCVAWLLLIALFFGVITPSALLYRLTNRRRRDRQSGSAWHAARPPRDKASYFRQF
jgi:hypothetical protein